MLLLQTISCNGTDLFWPFFWWLLGAFLLGLLIPWLLKAFTGSNGGDDGWKEKYDSLDGKYNVLHNRNNKLQKENEEMKLKVAGASASAGISASLSKSSTSSVKKDETDWKAKYEECVREKEMNAGATAAAAPVFAGARNKDEGVRDDLTKVEGIGPKICEMIYNGGIYTYKHLSEADVNYLRQILDEAGPAFKVHQPGTWPAQAKMAHEGRWDELKSWQDELKGGK